MTKAAELEIHQMKVMDCFFNSVRIYDKIIELYKKDYNNCMIARELGISVTNIRQRIEKFENNENIVLKTKNIFYISKYENAFESSHLQIIYKMLIASILNPAIPLLSDISLQKLFNVEKEIVDVFLGYALYNISKNSYFNLIPNEIKEEIT